MSKVIFVENVKPLQQHRCAIYANEHANVDFACKALYNRDIRKEIQNMAVTMKNKEGKEELVLYVKQADRDYARYCTGWRPGGMM